MHKTTKRKHEVAKKSQLCSELSYLYRIFYIRTACCPNSMEQILTYLRYDAFLPIFLFAHHRIGLSSTSLAIGKYTNVVAVEGMLQHFFSNVFVNDYLR